MDIQIELALIGFFQAIVLAVVGGVFARESRKQKQCIEKMEIRAVLRAEESQRAMELMSSSVSLSKVIARALSGKKTNGDVEAALHEADIAQQKYFELINAVAAAKFSGVATEEFKIK